MKKTRLKQVGKIGRINTKANKEIAQMWIDEDIQFCEACRYIYEIEGKLDWDCIQASSNAHRHERVWYRSKPELLWHFKQVIRACISAHTYLDRHPELREKVFILLRGKENDS